jgi:uncharacterized membrane protein YdbT with pleckstrin-like domain
MFGQQMGRIISFVENLFMIIVWVYGFLIWIDYYFDVWIITTERLINIEQKGLFSRKVSELTYPKVQDVTTSIKGFFPTVINYGDVLVQTAGETENFLFRTVTDPQHIKKVIMDFTKAEEKEGIEELGQILKQKINP